MAGEQVLVIDDSPTILKVVQLVLSKAGFVVRTAGDGEEGVRAAREERPDLILLDFVMPKMNGYQVCRALAETDELRDVPVVLMSAKGDQVGERFVKVMGIVDYITKPFSPDAITAVVSHTVSKYARTGGESSGLVPTPVPTDVDDGDDLAAEAAELADAPESVEREQTSPRMNESGRLRKIALEGLREAIARAAAAAPDPEGDLVGDSAADRIRARLSDGDLENALRELDAWSFDPQLVLHGDLGAVPLAEVLSLLAQQRQTGVLSVRGGVGKVEVYFRGGKVEYAASEGLGEEFLLGRYLTALESISRQDLDLFLQSRGPTSKLPGRLIGDQLLKLNYITEQDLRAALARQTAERIYEMMRWTGGRFGFRTSLELGVLADGAALGLTVDAILMEGARRVDEWHLIEREVDDFDAVYLRNEEAVKDLGRAQLTREEVAVLELVTGKNSVKDIVRQSRMGSFEVSKMLFRLRSVRLIRRRVDPVAVV